MGYNLTLFNFIGRFSSVCEGLERCLAQLLSDAVSPDRRCCAFGSSSLASTLRFLPPFAVPFMFPSLLRGIYTIATARVAHSFYFHDFLKFEFSFAGKLRSTISGSTVLGFCFQF